MSHTTQKFDARNGLEYSNAAHDITRRLAESVVRVQYSRADLDSFEDGPTEDQMVGDAIMVSLGDDTGCLGNDEMTAEYIDVLFVEQKLQDFSAGVHEALVAALNAVLPFAEKELECRESSYAPKPDSDEAVYLTEAQEAVATIRTALALAKGE